ncbi:MAG: FIST C-terminal domain-containing protein [Gammaproteobacteria bacterium]|nr:FIST C-terminal domain-containing protein [Gammaproteobacteria bacterium]
MSDSRFNASCATGPDWETVIDACIAGLDDIPADTNFGFIYVTDPLAPYLDNMLTRLHEQTGVQEWTGSVGSGICCTAREIYDEPAAAIMLAALPADSFRLIPAGIAKLADTLSQQQEWIKHHNVHFGIVHGDPRDRHIQQVIESLSTQLDPGFLVGGLSSADEEMNQLQVAGETQQNGLSGVLLSADVPVISSLSQGCAPLENKHVITKCQGNLLAELDGQPALDIFKQDIGEVLAKDLSRVAGYIFAALPIPGSDTGDYLVRNLIGIDPQEKLLAIGDDLEEDTQLMFCRRDRAAAREDMERMLDDLGKRTKGNIRGGVYYSCLGRGRNQFGEDSEELQLISDRLGDFPLVGFFANGEISHNRLYGYTGVLTLFI